jgi:hypothetical protein
MLVFDILTESLFNVSLSEDKLPGFDCNEFMKAEDASLREAFFRVLFPFSHHHSSLPSHSKLAQESTEKILFLGL